MVITYLGQWRGSGDQSKIGGFLEGKIVRAPQSNQSKQGVFFAFQCHFLSRITVPYEKQSSSAKTNKLHLMSIKFGANRNSLILIWS